MENKFNKEDFKVGYFFKFDVNVYTIVSVFEDNGETFYTAKKDTNYGIQSYANIFSFYENGELYKHV